MKLPEYAWIEVSPIQPWNIAFPNLDMKGSNKLISFPLALGFSNQIESAILKKKTDLDMTKAFPVRIMKKNGNLYKAGPIVGILTTNGSKRFRGNRKNFKDLIKAGVKTGVLIFVFTVESINPITKDVLAHFYLPLQDKWMTKKMPFPDVVYNRIPSRKEEEKSAVQEAIHLIKEENIPFFNPYFFNKWSLYQWMKDSYELKDLVPDTTYLTKEHLKTFLTNTATVYLKPISGKAGIGFIRIKLEDSSYLLTYQAKEMKYNQVFYNFPQLWNKILSLINDSDYIIQNGVDLSTYKGRPYDLRILAQKNGFGKWMISGIGIRIAGQKSITTHVPRGGSIQSFEDVISDSFHANITEEIKIKLSKLAIKIANHLEKKVGEPLGEVSMDMGIDQRHRVWFFEANAKPMEFDEPYIRETSLLRLMQYFRYLSGFVPKEVVS